MSKRKSDIGSNPKITREPPPAAPGKPWWTQPPSAIVLTEYLDYAKMFRQELVQRIAGETSKTRQLQSHQLISAVNAWIKAANIYETAQIHQDRSLPPTTLLLKQMWRLVCRLLKESGIRLTDVEQVLMDDVNAKCTRERAPTVLTRSAKDRA
jgi:hypothetical protein